MMISKNKTLQSIVIVCILFLPHGCTTKTEEILYTQKEPIKVLTNLITEFPGNLHSCEDYLLWESPFSGEYFANVVGKTDGRKIGAFGKTGRAPGEFNMPVVASCNNKEVLVFDMATGRRTTFSIPKLLSGEKYYTPLDSMDNVQIAMSTRLAVIDNNRSISLNPETETFLTYIDHGKTISFGENPISDGIPIHNSWDIFQGNIAFHPQRNILVYMATNFSYMAIYLYQDSKFGLIHEYKGDFSFKRNGNEINLDNTKRGAFDLALTKDYIVALQRDYNADPMDETKVGRDFCKIPKTVFVFDYNGNLLEIAHLGANILRLAGNPENNILHAIIIDDEFKIAAYHL